MQNIRSPLQAQVVQWLVQPGESAAAGDVLVILEAMKMEHEIRAPHAGRLAELYFQAGETVGEGEALASWTQLDSAPERGDAGTSALVGALSSALTSAAAAPALVGTPQTASHAAASTAGQTSPRADLQKLQDRLAFTFDAQRPEAVAKRHATGLRTARENIADLCDPDSFVEYGALAVAAQSRRRSADDLMRNTPADGMVTGIGCVNGQRVVVMAYDFTVLAGTQGMRNHQKTDRMLGVALQNKLPVVLFAEGGGGRPGDVDVATVGKHERVLSAQPSGERFILFIGNRTDANFAQIVPTGPGEITDDVIELFNQRPVLGDVVGKGLGTNQHAVWVIGCIDCVATLSVVVTNHIKHRCHLFNGRANGWGDGDCRPRGCRHSP